MGSRQRPGGNGAACRLLMAGVAGVEHLAARAAERDDVSLRAVVRAPRLGVDADPAQRNLEPVVDPGCERGP